MGWDWYGATPVRRSFYTGGSLFRPVIKGPWHMERWIAYAFISMAFAGFTSVIAKLGLSGISGDLGLAVRTCFVFVFVLMFAAAVVPAAELASLNARNVAWLALSAVTTAGSWIFYYKAIKLGDVSTVALIDKGSVVIA